MGRRRFRKIQIIWAILVRIWNRYNATNVSLLAAALSFYTMLSIFPALTTLISAYGLFAAPQTVEQQLALAHGILPDEALTLLHEQVVGLLDKNNSTLGFGFVIGLVLTLWSARSAALAIMTALNAVHGNVEKRGIVKQQFVALALTLGGIVTIIAALIALAVVPAILAFLPFTTETEALLSDGRWPIMMAVVLASFSLIYRFAPCREQAGWLGAFRGAVVAGLLWIAGSVGFSLYVSSLGDYDKIYGSLGAVVVLLFWFYVSATALLIGGAVDAELTTPSTANKKPALDLSKAG